VLSYGLDLKERLRSGVQLDIDTEQATLKGLLGSDSAARRHGEFGGDSLDRSVYRGAGGGDPGKPSTDHFLGIRYALTCWLDEMSIMDSPWESKWNSQKLETTLYGTNDRAWLFWEQAKKAETRPGGDALEAFFLCVMLGFQGQMRDQQADLQNWIKTAQTQISKRQKRQPPMIPDKGDPATNVPPRAGQEQLQRMVLVAGGILLLFIPIVV